MDFRLDHFKFYEVQPYSTPASPELKGQFDVIARPFALGLLQQFANPVSKNGEGIKNRNHHLTAYDIATTRPDPVREVVLENQFGRQEIRIGAVSFLLVPAHKMEPGIDFPKDLDHYKCYHVLNAPVPDRIVSLKDQFDNEEKVQVWEPRHFCVPCVKTYGGKTYDIINPDDHLTLYRIVSKEYHLARNVQDQFQKKPIQLAITRSAGLAVPSVKLEWRVADGESNPE